MKCCVPHFANNLTVVWHCCALYGSYYLAVQTQFVIYLNDCCYYYIHLTACFPGQPCKPVPER